METVENVIEWVESLDLPGSKSAERVLKTGQSIYKKKLKSAYMRLKDRSHASWMDRWASNARASLKRRKDEKGNGRYVRKPESIEEALLFASQRLGNRRRMITECEIGRKLRRCKQRMLNRRRRWQRRSES